MLQTKGRCVRDFTARMWALARGALFSTGFRGRWARALAWRAVQWNTLTLRLMWQAKSDREQVGAASFDYLMYSGYVMMAYHWALMAQRAQQALDSGKLTQSTAFYQAKIETARFYFERLLPRADAHYRTALAPASTLMQMHACPLQAD